jgi:biopolymer transport protein ExbB
MTLRLFTVVLVLALGIGGPAALAPGQADDQFNEATRTLQRQLERTLSDLDRLRQRIAEEKIPLSAELNRLQEELLAARREAEQTTRLLDSRTLDLSNLRAENEARTAEVDYLSNSLLGEYVRNFTARLHVSETQRYRTQVDETTLAMENSSLEVGEVFAAQARLLELSIDRLEEALGGTRFPGTAVAPDGRVRSGQFALLGPYAVFNASGRTPEDAVVGVAEPRINSQEPIVVAFGDPLDATAAASLVETGTGFIPLDPTLGDAVKVEATNETLWEHMQKGGPVMVPIIGLAALSLSVALYKWISMMFVRRPSSRRVRGFLERVAAGDRAGAMDAARGIGGPVGLMLSRGVEHMAAPRELVEEIMYETVLTTRLRLQRALPFIAICAAAAPLLGLLGTVTGIINTFKLITLFGSGDVKTLSGGISEALITTEFGLITAIPSLLLHAFLSRRARGVVDQMEKTAVAFVNQLGKTPYGQTGPGTPPPPPHAPVPTPGSPAPAAPAPAPASPRTPVPPAGDGGQHAYPEVTTTGAGRTPVPAGASGPASGPAS